MTMCPVCGKHPLSRVEAKRCRYCYYKRIGIKSEAKKNFCVDCKKELSGIVSKRCLDCRHSYVHDQALKNKEQKKFLKENHTPLDASQQIREPLSTFEEGWSRFQETIGMMRDRYKGSPPQKTNRSGRKRILVIPDLHIPFHEPEMVADMVAKEAKNTDLAICIGDVGDAYALSRFAKYESVPYAYEWSEVTIIMQMLSESFPHVRIIVGNHDARLRKAIASHLTPDMVEAITTMTGGTLCPLTALARKYKNIEIAHHPVPNSDITIDWLTVEGDALLAHPEKYSRVPGSALRAFEEWASDNSSAIGLESIRLLEMGHTHQLAVLPWRSSSLLVECGCLCKTQAYMTGARIGGRPQRRGYVWFDQYDGITDLNSVGFRWYDVEKKA